MEEILTSTLLQNKKSTFLLDIIKHKKEVQYVRITQIIGGGRKVNELNIHPSILEDIIKILGEYKSEVSTSKNADDKISLSEANQQRLIERYYKGIAIKDLAMQFNCKPETIKLVLIHKGIDDIVENGLKIEKSFYKYWWWKRKK